MRIIKQAAIGGAGSVAFDMLMAKVRQYLPASLQPTGTGPGLYDAVYVGLAVLLGKGLSKSTKGLSEQMAAGALTVQAARLMAPMVAKVVPSTAPAVAGIGYLSPNPVIPGSARVGAYTRGATPLLSGVGAYTRPGSPSPLLSGSRIARAR